MQRRAAAMYVLLFLVIAVGALGFINLTDGPSETIENPDYEVPQGETVTIDGVEYELSTFSEFTGQLTYLIESAEQTVTYAEDDLINVSGTEYRVVLPDGEGIPTNATLVETYPEHDLNTTEDNDGNTLVQLEDGSWILEETYLEQEYGARDEIEVTESDTIDFIPADSNISYEATVSGFTTTGVTFDWVGPTEDTVLLQRDSVNEIGSTEFGAVFIDQEYLQLTSDLDAFEAHLDAHDTWEERYQGFWGVGVLSVIGAVLIGALSYLPRRE